MLPALGAAAAIALALPVFLIAGWPLGGWALAGVLWFAVHALDLLLAQVRKRTGKVAPGVQAFGLFFKSIGLLVVLLAVAVTSPRLAVAAALTYAVAYTLELGLSLLVYFGSTR
jgi:hypothetical protein